MKGILFCCAATLSAASLFAAPRVTAVSIAETGNPFKVKVNYTLADEPAIITFEVRTNNVPVKGIYRHAVGDVNHLVQPDENRTISWACDLDWPGHLITEPSVKVVVRAYATNDPPDYAIIDLAGRGFAPMFFENAEDVPGGITSDDYKTQWMVLRRIHAAGAVFRRGALNSDTGYDAKFAANPVTFTKDFYIGVYPVTKRQYELAAPKNSISTAFGNAGMSDSPYLKETDAYAAARPAVMVQPQYYVVGNYPWPANKYVVDSTHLLGKLRSLTGIDSIYLPTEAQWEFACRAGSNTLFANGSNNDMDELGWNSDNNADDPRWTEGIPHAVGLKKPNAFGLYDMHGNVAEFCMSREGNPQLNADGSPYADPDGPASGNYIWLGGSFSDAQEKCAAFRFLGTSGFGYGAINCGYRVICDVEGVCK